MLEIGFIRAQIFFRADDHDVRKPASQLIKAMPLFPGPLVLAARMNGDGSGWQIKLPARRHGERLRKLALPAEVARDLLDATDIAFGQPAPAIEEMHAPCLYAVSEGGAPRCERGNVVGLVGEAFDLSRPRASTGTWQVEHIPNLRCALQQFNHVRIIGCQEHISFVAEPMDNADQRRYAQNIADTQRRRY